MQTYAVFKEGIYFGISVFFFLRKIRTIISRRNAIHQGYLPHDLPQTEKVVKAEVNSSGDWLSCLAFLFILLDPSEFFNFSTIEEIGGVR